MFFQDDEEKKEAAASDHCVCNPVYEAGLEPAGSEETGSAVLDPMVSERHSSSQQLKALT